MLESGYVVVLLVEGGVCGDDDLGLIALFYVLYLVALLVREPPEINAGAP